MKKFVYALLTVLLILVGLEKAWDFLIKENKNIKLSHAVQGGLQDGRYNELLIHGPCEPLFTISPKYLDSLTGIKSYNYALRHTDFADNYLHLYLYLKHNKAPDKMYLYVTPESFDLRFNTFHTFRFAAWLEDSLVSEVVKEMDPDYYQYSWIPFMKYAYYNTYKTFDALQGFKHWIASGKDPYFADGHVPHGPTDYANNPGNESDRKPNNEQNGYIAPKTLTYANGNEVEKQEDGGTYYEIYDSAQNFVWDGTREKYLIRIIELAQKHGVEVFLYESTPYKGSIINQPNRQDFLGKTEYLAQGLGVKYLLFDSLDIGRDKSNFVCPLIVGEAAGKEFMQVFATTILNDVP
jgi:hypothetical protein